MHKLWINRDLFFWFLFFLPSLPVFSTVVEGKDAEYAGKKLNFFRYADPVTKEKKPVFSLEFDAEGNFSRNIDIDITTFVFCDFGIYRGMLFLEPQKKLHLLFPPFRPKSFADQKNPFFEPVNFWFATKSKNHLNDWVATFDAHLNQLTDNYFHELFLQQSRQAYDTLLKKAELQQQGQGEPLLKMHRDLKLSSVRSDAFRLKPADLSKILNRAEPRFWTHPSFVELLDNTFANQLSYEIKSTGNQSLKEAIANSNSKVLTRLLKEKYRLSGPVAELVVLKMLHDAFYSGDFQKESIIQLTAADFFQDHSHPLISTTAQNVLEKLKHLRRNSKAPIICLKNTDGVRKCSNENSDKFKYLIFADTEMIVCREHLKYVTKIKEKFNKHLEIILVLRKTDIIEMKMFLNKQKIPGTHLVDEEGKFIEEYGVRSFPVCFLLDEEHNVVFPQAKAPLDGFEQQFGAFLQKELFERQRNQAR